MSLAVPGTAWELQMAAALPPPITDHPLGEPKALPILPRAFDPLGHRVHPPPALPKSCAVVQRLCERRALLDAPSLQ